MKRIIIAGGSGFLGKGTAAYFKKNAQIIIFTRGESKIEDGITYVHWDAKTLGDWFTYLNGCDVLINFTGKSVDCRYHQKNKELILNSRIDSTRILGKAIALSKVPPKLWINSSTATIYRHALTTEMTEAQGEIGSGFSVAVAQAWEKAFFTQETPKTRKVALRTSIVLGKQGGALQPMKYLAQFGFGGKQGRGNQKFSWIHELDFVRCIAFIIKTATIKGPVNIVAPKPSDNATLMKNICAVLKVPFGLPLSKWMLSLGARMIRTEPELILKSRNVVPKILLAHGFKFKYPNLKQALASVL